MPCVILVGAQWGDEGKGKIIDVLAPNIHHIVRAQGGNNAGHTVVMGDKEFKLLLIPCGILYPHIQCYIGPGMVVDPAVLMQEIQDLEASGISTKGRLWISPSAHVVFPYHRKLDNQWERLRGKPYIGTTGRGMGPCYADKVNRMGIRVGEWIRPDLFTDLLKRVLPLKNEELVKLYREKAIPLQPLYEEYCEYAKFLKGYVGDVSDRVNDALEKGDNVLLEGKRGTLLDITLGTYPYVTSSNTVAGGLCAGAGIGPSKITHTLGVTKAYMTRIGKGVLPSALEANESIPKIDIYKEHPNQKKRQVGWFDAVLIKTAIRFNGLESLAMKELDAFDDLEEIKICTGYNIRGTRYMNFPPLSQDLAEIEPIYEVLPGWQESTEGVPFYDALPPNAKRFVERIEELCGVPVSMLTIDGEQTLMMDDPFQPKEHVYVR